MLTVDRRVLNKPQDVKSLSYEGGIVDIATPPSYFRHV